VGADTTAGKPLRHCLGPGRPSDPRLINNTERKNLTMKKNFSLIVCLLAVSLAWVGCNKAGKLNQRSEFKPPTGPMEFKQKWPLGERIEQDLDMKMKSEISIPGQPAPMKQDTTMGQAYGLTVLQANPDGTHEIEMDFLSARMGMKMGEKTLMEYDSEKKSATDKPNPLADVFAKIVGSKIRYFLNASNAVDRIEGVDDLISRLSAGANAQATAPLKSMYSEGYFKQMMSANLFLPPKPVQPGDSWPVQYEIPLGMMGTMTMNYDFTFQNWEMHGKRNCARLEFSGSIQTKPDPSAKPGAMSISIQDGTCSGISWFDPELGITIDTTMNQDFKMVMLIPQNQKPKPGVPAKMQSLTNQMNQVMTIKLVSVK
jgi:hypothetical protein